MKKKKKSFPFIENDNLGVLDWTPLIDDNYIDVNSNSWFDINICHNPDTDFIDEYDTSTCNISKYSHKQQMTTIKRRKLDKDPKFIYTRKIKLFPNENQKIILQEWFAAATRMFNFAVIYIREMIYHNGKLISLDSVHDIIYKTDFRALLKNYRDKIIQDMTNPMPCHVLDELIQQVVSNHKTCLTNIENGYIQKFRIRIQSYIRRRHILKIESQLFSKGSFCINTFPEINSSEPLVNITSTATLLYDRDSHKYILLVPATKMKKERVVNVLDCGIDLGVRTFATVYSNANAVFIGNDIYKNIKKYHRKIDKINELLSMKAKESIYETKTVTKEYVKVKGKMKTIKKIKFAKYTRKIDRRKLKRGLRKYHKRINDMVKDLHYKCAHYLVNNYDNIFIGKLSTKSILSRNNKKITKKTKRMIGVLAPYRFRQVLAYMGLKYGNFIGEVDEYLTTRTCCNCGKVNEIGSKKVHHCACGMKTDRDVVGAKNHLKKGYVQYPTISDHDLEIYHNENDELDVVYNKITGEYEVIEI